MPTTAHEAYPYPDDEEWLQNGAYAIEQLAQRLDDRNAKHNGTGGNGATAVALPNNAWTPVAVSADPAGSGFTSDGTTLTYTATQRWCLVSFGANVAVSGTQPNGGLRLVLNGSVVVAELLHDASYQNLNACIPLVLAPGSTLTVQAYANDGAGSAGGAQDRAWLRAVAL